MSSDSVGIARAHIGLPRAMVLGNDAAAVPDRDHASEASVDAEASAFAGRYVVLTGGSSGIGRALATRLRAGGASVLVGSRRAPGDGLDHLPLDLAAKASVAEFARTLVREGRPIDALVLNAGVHVPWASLTTVDGEELHWQVNYLSNFLLCHLLLDLCHRSTLRRVVYVASEAHRLASLPAARSLLGFWYRYARSKEAAVTFFLRLRERHPELEVRIVSPRGVDSEIHRHKTGLTARLERAWFARPCPAETAAREIVRTGLLSGPTASGYWNRGASAWTSGRSRDAARADALWRASLASLGDLLPGERAPRPITNFARTFEAVGPEVERPESLDELSAIVGQAAERGQTVRVVGRRHSYNDGFYSRVCMVSIERLPRFIRVQPERGTVTCDGATSIGELCAHLDRQGFALKYCGNYGEQTLAGALATGTHGYGREGGVMSELVRAATVVLADGRRLHTADERDLRALRLSLGTLGVVVEVTLAIEPIGPCRYETACLPREEFNDRLDAFARENEYLRFVPHPFDASSVLYVTINRLAAGSPVRPAAYISEGEVGSARLLVPWLRMPAVRTLLGKALGMSGRRYSLDVPFSSLLFIRTGVVPGRRNLARAGQLALDRSDWLDMDLAIPRNHYREFARLFAEAAGRARRGRGRPYYGCRVVGAARNVLLAPNYDRDVVFASVHADPDDPGSKALLAELEKTAVAAWSARPHWGKVFSAGQEAMRALYPAENLAAFREVKGRLDPRGVFSNDYTRRVLGL